MISPSRTGARLLHHAARWAAGAALGISGLTFGGCAKSAPAAAAQVLRIAQRNEPATLDPQLATLPDEFFVIRALSEGLVTPNPAGGAPRPAAAESWEVSADGLTWTFHLRPDAKWSNGDPVTADDFVYTARRALTPAVAAPRAALFLGLREAPQYYRGELTDFSRVGIAAPAPQTLVINLARPSAELLAIVASGPWIPVHRATVEKDPRRWTEPGRFVGNGRFLLAQWQPSQRITVRRNPAHWDSAGTELAAVEFVALDNGDTEERAFRAGQLDVTMAVPAAKLDTYREARPPVLRTVALHETRYLALNTRRAPLNDDRVRRALSLALDRAALVAKVLKAGQQPALTFVPPGLGGFRSTAAAHEDAAEARRLLAAAGFPGGKGFPRLELSTWPVSGPQLEAIQQMWREQLGIEVALVQREAKTHLAALAAGDFDLGFATAIPDFDGASDLLVRLTTGNASNYSQWSDPGYDAQVAAGDTQLPAAEDRLLQALPVIPLYFNTKNILVRPAVRGWREDALWTRFYDHVSLEP